MTTDSVALVHGLNRRIPMLICMKLLKRFPVTTADFCCDTKVSMQAALNIDSILPFVLEFFLPSFLVYCYRKVHSLI